MSKQHITPTESAIDDVPIEGRTAGRRALLRTMAIGAVGTAAAGAVGPVGARPTGASDPNDLDLTVASNALAGRSGANYTAPTWRRGPTTVG